MKIYVMGSSNELELCKRMMDRLREVGYTIAHDWVADVEKNGGGNPAHLTDVQAARYAEQDLKAIETADIYWFILPETVTRGAWVEFGYILGFQNAKWESEGLKTSPIIVSGNKVQSIFTRLCSKHYDTHDKAL
jgi:hypothetical protein